MNKLSIRRTGLMLTRRPGEAIMIGDDIVITLSGINGNQARILVSAPKELPVHREEIYERVRAEQSDLATTPAMRRQDRYDVLMEARGAASLDPSSNAMALIHAEVVAQLDKEGL